VSGRAREREGRLFVAPAAGTDASGPEGSVLGGGGGGGAALQAATSRMVVLDPSAANRIAAKALKAKMRGDAAGERRLRALEAAAKAGRPVAAEDAEFAGVMPAAAQAPKEKRDAWAAAAPGDEARRREPAPAAATASHRRSARAGDDDDSSGDDASMGTLGRRRKRGRAEDGGVGGTERDGSDDDDDDGPELDEEGREVVVVSGLDRRGVPIRSLQAGVGAEAERADFRPSRKRGKRRLDGLERDEEGNVLRYGAGDEEVSLEEMVRRERLGGGPSADDRLASSISRMRRGFKGSTLSGSRAGADEDEDLDVRLVRGDDDRLTPAERRRRDLRRAGMADSRAARAEASDPLNPESDRFPRHLVVAAGLHWVVLAAPGRALHPLHSVLAPRAAAPAVASMDEDAYAEGNAWRAALHRAFASPLPEGSAQRALEDDEDGGWEAEPPVFCETVMDARPGRARRTRVDVIPLTEEAAADVGVFFGKALQEAEEDPTHKAVIHTRGKGLRRCVPTGFAYAHVAWAGDGMVHPIDDASTFSRSLLLDVAAGLLGVPPMAFGRRDQARPEREGALAAERLARRLLARGTACIDADASRSMGAAVVRVAQSEPAGAATE